MRQSRIPRYSRHKATGQARVCIDGRDRYLGPYGSVESKERYRSLVDQWQLRRQSRCPVSLTLGQLVLLYDDFARDYFVKNGRPTSEPALIKAALRPLIERYSRTPAADFGPRDLKAVRDEYVAGGLARTTVNAYARRVVAMLRWGVSEEYVPPEVLTALRAVAGLRKGRTPAPETKPVGPVSAADVEAVLPLVSPQVRDMIRLQLLSGCRPGEVVSVRPGDLDRIGETWEYAPTGHKTEHHGQDRRVFFGPQAQAVLAPYLDRGPKAFCFSPAEAEQIRREELHAARQTPLSCGNRARKHARPEPARPPGERYTSASYRKAIHRACDAANLPRWSPNRLRHSRATELRRLYGVEVARTVLGHAKLGTTEVYAERDFDQARGIMAEIG